MDQEKIKELIDTAIEARKKSYSPYSGFSVGAALLTTEGRVFTGTNVENVSYGLTNCAERTAVFKAVSEGYYKFEAVAIAADTEKPVPPCGSCRQVILEFGEDIKIIMANLKGEYLQYNIKELLPGAFNREDLV